jgi:3,4-dihydroxy 2-butanone 4-phosphate synthase/GTP cyclohydrolase II
MINNNKLAWVYSNTLLPTKYGKFKVYVFHNSLDKNEHLAIVKGEIGDGKNIPVRVHSECLTSEVLGSLKCDCREQLQNALQYISKKGRGLVLYLRQEGRGIGLGNKIRAYALQEAGFDTVQANHMLGFPDDLRRYDVAAAMLKELGVHSIQLLTNNPSKINGLQEYGIEISERIPLQVEPNPINRFYLMTKSRKSGHLLDFSPPNPDLSKLKEAAG